jgi:hypothetical protein
MKILLIGLLAIGSISAFGSTSEIEFERSFVLTEKLQGSTTLYKGGDKYIEINCVGADQGFDAFRTGKIRLYAPDQNLDSEMGFKECKKLNAVLNSATERTPVEVITDFDGKIKRVRFL